MFFHFVVVVVVGLFVFFERIPTGRLSTFIYFFIWTALFSFQHSPNILVLSTEKSCRHKRLLHLPLDELITKQYSRDIFKDTKQ